MAQAGEVRSARVESIRAIAALGVLAGHVYGTTHAYREPEGTLERLVASGSFSVYVFFVLSGYLLFWPLALVGVASYSLYLWHVLVVHELEERLDLGTFPSLFAVAGPASVAVAVASYALVERPFLTLRRRWGERPLSQASTSNTRWVSEKATSQVQLGT